MQSLGVFFSPVHLSGSGVPDGMRLTFETNPVTPPIGGVASSTLAVVVSGAPLGTHTITITAGADSLTHVAVLTVQVAGGACLIATATYGSELSEEVQFLRNFRDNSILKTNAGSDFMVAFNAWYYSFSPGVAQFIGEHSAARTVVKSLLYPLIGILRIGAAAFDLLPTGSEAGAVLSGLVVSSLIGAVYLSIPLTIAFAYSPRARPIAKRLRVPALVMLLGALASVAFATVVGAPATLIMIATSVVVLTCLAASALFVSSTMLHVLRSVREVLPRRR